MAKGKSTWKYNKLLTARRNYFALGGQPNNPFQMDFTTAAYHDYRGDAGKTRAFVQTANANGANIDTGNLPGSLGGGSIKGPNIFQQAGSQIKGMLSGGAKGLISAMGGPAGLLGAAAGAVGDIGGKLLSNGLESKAGGIVSGVGDALGGIPIIGGVAKGALNLIGGGVNALFGSKLNQANISAVEGATARANAVRSNATDFDTLANTMGSTADIANFSDSYIGKDGLFSNKAKKRAAALRAEAKVANARQALALLSNAEDIQSDTLRNLEANYAAFGGPMDFGGGAIGYDFMNKYLGIKELAALGQDATLSSLPNSFAEGGGIHIKKANRGKFTDYCGGNVTAECIARGKRSSSSAVRKRATFAANARKWKHAFGGDLLTHGSNFDTGVTLIGNGGTHEENPNEGVPMGMDAEGTPNLVEEGEVIFNDYVFSNRLRVPKEVRKKYKLKGTKPLTFADAAIQMSKESEERPNDPISQAGLEDGMMKLMIAQEQLREKKAGRRYAKGGRLGRRYEGKGDLPNQFILSDGSIITGDPNDASYISELDLPNDDVTQSEWYGKPKPPKTRKTSGSNDSGLAPTWMRYVPAFASGIMSITDAAGLTNKPDYSEADMVLDAARGAGTYSPVGFSPIGNYLGYTPFDREFYINQMNAQADATRRAIMQNAGLNRGAGMAALLASDYNTQGQFGQLARQAEEYNLAQRQKAEEFNRATNMFNTEGALKADMANQEAMLKVRDSYLKGTLSAAELRQRERQQAAAARSANLSNFINSLGDIGRENFARNMIVSDPSKYYSIGANGEVTYKASFDDLSEAEQDYVRGHASRKSQSKKARGGYLTRKKKKIICQTTV